VNSRIWLCAIDDNTINVILCIIIIIIIIIVIIIIVHIVHIAYKVKTNIESNNKITRKS